MIEYISKYKELINKLEVEKKLLEELNNSINQTQNKFQDCQNTIDNLIKEKKELEDCITQIIDNKLNKVKRISLFFAIVLITTILGIISVASKFNIGIVFPVGIYSMIGCCFFNVSFYSFLERFYRKKEKKIVAMQDLINEKELELSEHKDKKTNLLEERRNAVINYYNQKHRVSQIENLINEIKIDYATPIFDREIKNSNNEEKPLTKVRKINVN